MFRPTKRRASIGTVAVVAIAAVLLPAQAVAAPSAHLAPGVRVLTTTPSISADHNHYLFLTPGAETVPTNRKYNGAEIVDMRGHAVWFHGVPRTEEASDLQIQRYHGRPVLTWWQGTGFGYPSASGTDYIYGLGGKLIAKVKAGNGFNTDGHEFQLTSKGTALVQSLRTSTADITALGGPASQTIVEEALQEVDVNTGKVLFEWNPKEHVPFSQSEVPIPGEASKPWDWFHANTFHVDKDGNFLINARNTWTLYKVSPGTGQIIWQLGGKASSFKLRTAVGQSLDASGAMFAWEHDPRAVGNDEYTVFADEGGFPAVRNSSRAIVVKLNPSAGVATLVKSYPQPLGQVAHFEGSAERLSDGNMLVGWGFLQNCCSIFSPGGNLLFNASFKPKGVSSYRVFMQPLDDTQLKQLASPAWAKVPQ